MADKYLLECPSCGAETDAPGSAYGQSVECHACGDDVPVTDATIIRKQEADPDRRGLRIEQPGDSGRPGVSSAVEQAFGGDDDDEDVAHPTFANPEPPRHSPMREHDPIAAGPEKCVRCGRPFRGDWDEFETAEGTICYVCSNLAVEGIPERVRKDQEAAQPAVARTPASDRLIEKEAPPRPPEQTFLGYDTSSPEFRRWLIGAAIATIAIAWLIMITGWGAPETPRGPSASAPSAEDIPVELGIAWSIVFRLARYAVLGLTIYLVLWWRNGLPHETVVRNVMDIGLVVIICAVVGLVFAFFGSLVDYGGDVGWIPAAIVYALGWMVQGAIVIKMFDWRFLDLLWAAVFFAIANFLVYSVLKFVFGAIARLAT